MRDGGKGLCGLKARQVQKGNRCSVLLNVHDMAVVTPCHMVKNYFHFKVSYLLYSQRLFVQHFF